MKIYAKAALDRGEFQEKIKCGCDGIEIQLMSDYLIHGKEYRHYYEEELWKNYNIEVIHTPGYPQGQMMNIERIFLQEDIKVLEYVFALAEECAEIWKHRVMVIIHTSISFTNFLEYEILQKRIKDNLGKILDNYPLTDLVIENVIPLEYKTGNTESQIYLCNGYYMDVIQIVKWLQCLYGDRIGSVLDVCHAKITKYYMESLLQNAGLKNVTCMNETIDFGMESYFQKYADTCRLIHFNNSVGNGFEVNHGIGFDDRKDVNAILQLYHRYNYMVPLTLEISEVDYLDCKNYRRLKKQIEECENMKIQS